MSYRYTPESEPEVVDLTDLYREPIATNDQSEPAEKTKRKRQLSLTAKLAEISANKANTAVIATLMAVINHYDDLDEEHRAAVQEYRKIRWLIDTIRYGLAILLMGSDIIYGHIDQITVSKGLWSLVLMNGIMFTFNNIFSSSKLAMRNEMPPELRAAELNTMHDNHELALIKLRQVQTKLQDQAEIAQQYLAWLNIIPEEPIPQWRLRRIMRQTNDFFLRQHRQAENVDHPSR
jgi:hypothetical protein